MKAFTEQKRLAVIDGATDETTSDTNDSKSFELNYIGIESDDLFEMSTRIRENPTTWGLVRKGEGGTWSDELDFTIVVDEADFARFDEMAKSGT